VIDRSVMARLLVTATLALVVVGCGGSSATSSGTASPIQEPPSGSPGAEESATPAALPSLDPAWLSAQAMTCDGHLYFSPAILAQPGIEEQGLDPAGQALKAYLAIPPAEENATRPSTGWHRVAQTATKVQFVAIATDRSRLYVVGLDSSSAEWQVDIEDSCFGEVRRVQGFGAADWWVDPKTPVNAEDRVIHGLLQETVCADGKPPKGRVAPPSIVYLDNAVVITMSVRKLPGVHDCVSNPTFPITIQLDQPLGDRRLLDGGRFPPRDATIPPQ
jgi:hypothetical protein